MILLSGLFFWVIEFGVLSERVLLHNRVEIVLVVLVVVKD